jgi:hypothetical protein
MTPCWAGGCFGSQSISHSWTEKPDRPEIKTMRRPRPRFTIGQLMILIAVVGLILGIAAWARGNPGLILLVALFSLIVLGPIGLQLYAIFWRDNP